MEEEKEEEGKNICECENICECNNTSECDTIECTSECDSPVSPPPLSRAKELPSAEVCPARRRWTFCPARARPSWIVRGACPLHDLMETRK
jgi:hypothetical protein